MRSDLFGLGYSPKEVAIIKEAMRLHDIGKSEIPSVILNKTKDLQLWEKELIHTHEVKGVELAKKYFNIKDPRILEIIGGHGSDGVTKLCAIAQMADQFDALVSPRVYRPDKPGLSPKEAFEVIKEYNIPQGKAPALEKHLYIYETFKKLYYEGKFDDLVNDSINDR